ncbi:MAG: glycosyltransferase family 2 protein [Candidatus Omnitrophica bacterium]|nr:glycosyltransferase family 2 protein [Candidatus Omnitrophota bacterium]
MINNQQKILVLIPAYNASRTIRKVLTQIPRPPVDAVAVVDDGSSDNTAQEIQSAKQAILIKHPKNRGYGGAQKTLHRFALEHQAPYSVILHADGGHFPNEIPQIVEPLLKGEADVVVGSRIMGIYQTVRPFLGSKMLGASLWGPMPGYKFVANRILSTIQNIFLGTRFLEFHSGFRAITKEALSKIPLDRLGNWYLFDTEFVVACHRAGLRIKEVPAGTYYNPEAGSKVPSVRYGLAILEYAFKDWLHRHFSGRRNGIASS